jgi:glycosyltransferase involved in cell wall biosynthesis
MKVSVVITTHDRSANILCRAIDSVLKQTYNEGIELIVINSAPLSQLRSEIDDALSVYLSDAKMEVRYYVADRDVNGSVARNIGTSYSNGEFIAFLDDDDEWFPEKIDVQSRSIGEADMVFSDYQVELDDGRFVLFSSIVGNVKDIRKDILGENVIGATSCPMIRTSMLNSIGGFDEELQSNQEWDVWIRLVSSNATIVETSDILAVKHISYMSVTSDTERRIEGWERLLSKNKDAYRHNRSQYARALWIFSKELRSCGRAFKSLLVMFKAVIMKFISMMQRS